MSATVGGCREVTVLLLPVVDIAVASAIVNVSVTLVIALSGGSAGPLGYPRVETPLGESLQTPLHRAHPLRDGLPLVEAGGGWPRAQLSLSP